MRVSPRSWLLRVSSRTGCLLLVACCPSNLLHVLTTPQPCSLNDFMDYLFYVEHNAESLQFFLWYCDYVERWSGLLPRQKALSQPWDPDKATEPRSRFITYSHKRARSDKMGKIMNIMEMDSEKRKRESSEVEASRGGTSAASSTNFSRPRTPPSAVLSPTGSAKEDWQPCKSFAQNHDRVVADESISHNPTLPRRNQPRSKAIHRRGSSPTTQPLHKRPRVVSTSLPTHHPPIGTPPSLHRRRSQPPKPPSQLHPLGEIQHQYVTHHLCARHRHPAHPPRPRSRYPPHPLPPQPLSTNRLSHPLVAGNHPLHRGI